MTSSSLFTEFCCEVQQCGLSPASVHLKSQVALKLVKKNGQLTGEMDCELHAWKHQNTEGHLEAQSLCHL